MGGGSSLPARVPVAAFAAARRASGQLQTTVPGVVAGEAFEAEPEP